MDDLDKNEFFSLILMQSLLVEQLEGELKKNKLNRAYWKIHKDLLAELINKYNSKFEADKKCPIEDKLIRFMMDDNKGIVEV